MITDLYYLYGKPTSTADLRTHNSDFIVEEILPFSPTGEGEHHMLHIRKDGLNTGHVAEVLAKFAKVHPKEVTYAGQKDKNAQTEQWFGIRIPGKETPDWQQLNSDQLTILSSARHGKKLRIGALLGNRFTLTLRNVTNIDALQQRFNQIAALGVPNYFGEQRFGHNGKNLDQGRQMLSGARKVHDRTKKSMYLSAVRSYIFNQVASYRLEHHLLKPLAGDCVMLAGSKSYFVAEQWDELLLKRLEEEDIGFSVPLWGRGQPLALTEAAVMEAEAIEAFADDLHGLENAGLSQERRLLLLKPQAMKLRVDGDVCTIEFMLPAGSYATSVLRELVDYQDIKDEQWKTMVADQQVQAIS